MEIHPKVNYWIDVVLGISFIIAGTSGIIMYFVPWGSDALVLGISRSVWPTIHEWSSFVMVASVLAHLVLHWGWLVAMTKGFFRKE